MVLPLVIELSLMSISLMEGNVNIEVLEGNAEGIVKNLFATTLLGTTIQDSGTRARSKLTVMYNVMLTPNPKLENKKINGKENRNEKGNRVHHLQF